MVLDESTATIHYKILVVGKASFLVKFTVAGGRFSILGRVQLQIMSITKTQPAAFITLVIDSNARACCTARCSRITTGAWPRSCFTT